MIAQLDKELVQQMAYRDEAEAQPTVVDHRRFPIAKRTDNYDSIMRGDDWSYLVEECSYDLFDLQDSGLVPV